MKVTDDQEIKVFADGADLTSMVEAANMGVIDGFTTNPTLMRKSGVDDYEKFARSVVERIADLPVSFEVFDDDLGEMRRQAKIIAGWGENIYVKIPVTNTEGLETTELIEDLTGDGLRLNVTAILALHQVEKVSGALDGTRGAIISVFAGRVADTGREPVPLMSRALEIVRRHEGQELLWASPREVLNVVQAASIGCDIITVTYDLLRKIEGLGRELDDVSLDTVRMFHDDAAASGYTL